MTICAKCGQSIKDVITINGKPYGTTCAHNILTGKGESMPRGFKGDYDAHKMKVDAIQKNLSEERKEKIQLVINLWNDAKILSLIGRKANDWERNFLYSIINQLGIVDVLICTNLNQYSDAFDYINSEHAQQYGLFTTRFSKGIDNLSPKQQNMIENMIRKYS